MSQCFSMSSNPSASSIYCLKLACWCPKEKPIPIVIVVTTYVSATVLAHLHLAESAQFFLGIRERKPRFSLSLFIGSTLLATWSCDLSWTKQEAPQDSEREL